MPDLSIEPKRIQRKRIKGWVTPAQTIYVGRGTRWGNPFIVVDGAVIGRSWSAVRARNLERPVDRDWGRPGANIYSSHSSHTDAVEHAVALFRIYCAVTERDHPAEFDKWIGYLGGFNLSCWCSLEAPCHADVLLELCAKQAAADRKVNR